MGTLLPLLGVLSAGIAAAGGLARAARLPAWWAAVCVLPLGLTAYGILVLPSVRLLGSWWGGILAAGLAVAGLVLARRGVLRSLPNEPAGWGGAAVLLAFAGAIGYAAGRFALAVIHAAPTPPLLGEPSTGDWGLHVLRAALIARHGVPPPSPLDPDFPLQYRYLFHALAAVFASASGLDVAVGCAIVTGGVLSCLVLAGGALAYLIRRSVAVMVCAGLLAALSGPTYWLPEALGLLMAGSLPTPNALASRMPDPWPMSPLAPAFPSMLTAQGSSPTLPFTVLTWFTGLICLGGALRAAPGGTARWAAAGAGAAFAALAFTADFFVPIAGLALLAGMLAAIRSGSHLRLRALSAAGASLVVLVALLLSSGQLGAAGAARDLRVGISSSLTTTSTYGGNHALLSGGTSIPLPNWIHVHDWGLAFWPGIVAAVIAAVLVRQPLLVASAVAALSSALVWHLLEITYATGTPTNTRVQMYRYASLSTALLAPLLPVVVGFATRGLPWAARGVTHALVLAIAAGGGLCWVFVAAPLSPAVPPQWAGDVELARRLALEPGPRRLVVLNAPVTFVTMYNAGSGGNLPLWWAYGETPVPVGWDFGYPERYEPLYRRVAQDMDPRAAAELAVTHIAFAPAALPPERNPALARLLRSCRGQLVAASGDPTLPTGRELYRLEPSTCTPSDAPA